MATSPHRGTSRESESRPRPSMVINHAVHEIDVQDDKNADLQVFFGLLMSNWSRTTYKAPEPDAPPYVDKNPLRFHISNNPDSMLLTILHHEARKHRRHRGASKWSQHDRRKMDRRIAMEMDDLGLMPDDLTVRFDTVTRISDRETGEGSRKIALTSERGTAVNELFLREREIVSAALPMPASNGREPYALTLPVGQLYRNVEQAAIDRCIERTKSLLPVTVVFEPITFRSYEETR